MRRLLACALTGVAMGPAASADTSLELFQPAIDDGIRACVAFMRTGRTGQHQLGYWDDLGLGSLSHDFAFSTENKSGAVRLTYGFAFVGRAMRPNNCFVRFNQDARWNDWREGSDSFAREEMTRNAVQMFDYAALMAGEVYGTPTEVRDSASGRGGFSIWCRELEDGTPVSIEAEWFANRPGIGPQAEVSFNKRQNEACDVV